MILSSILMATMVQYHSTVNVCHPSVYNYSRFMKKLLSAVWGRVTPICINELFHHWFGYWLVAQSVPSHYLAQQWIVVKRIIRNKIFRNLHKNAIIFSQENPLNMTCGKGWPFGISLSVLMRCSTRMAFTDNNAAHWYPCWSPWPGGM